MNKLRLRGKIISKSHMLENPEEYRDRSILCFEVEMVGKLKEYCKNANLSRQTLTLNNWSKDPTDAQRQKLFALIDRLTEHWCAGRMPSKKDKDDVYRQVIEMIDLVDENGQPINSIKKLDSAETSAVIDMILDWLASEGIDTTELR